MFIVDLFWLYYPHLWEGNREIAPHRVQSWLHWIWYNGLDHGHQDKGYPLLMHKILWGCQSKGDSSQRKVAHKEFNSIEFPHLIIGLDAMRTITSLGWRNDLDGYRWILTASILLIILYLLGVLSMIFGSQTSRDIFF